MDLRIPLININISISRKKSFSSKIYNKNYNKVFVIGFNKTGTTTLKKTLSSFGLKVGNQVAAEVLTEDWSKYKKADRIIRYCHTADAFQDLPFSKPKLYEDLDQAFPNSRFILTIRDTPEQWFQSLVNYYTKKFSTTNLPPTEKDLANATYRYKGFLLDIFFPFTITQKLLYTHQLNTRKCINNISSVRL